VSSLGAGLCHIKSDGLSEAAIKVAILFVQLFILYLWAHNKSHFAAIVNVESVKVKFFHRDIFLIDGKYFSD
jgi:hypothetical protein